MSKKIVTLFLLIVLVLGIVGCSKKEEPKTEMLKCDIFKCIELIDHTDKVETINEKIGLTGKKNEYTNDTYEWNLSNDVKLRATYGADGVSVLEMIFDKSVASDDTLNTSMLKKGEFDELQRNLLGNNLNKGYNNVVKTLGKDGIVFLRRFTMFNGTLDILTRYIWVKNDKCYVILGFDNAGNWTSSEIYAGANGEDTQC